MPAAARLRGKKQHLQPPVFRAQKADRRAGALGDHQMRNTAQRLRDVGPDARDLRVGQKGVRRPHGREAEEHDRHQIDQRQRVRVRVALVRPEADVSSSDSAAVSPAAPNASHSSGGSAARIVSASRRVLPMALL